MENKALFAAFTGNFIFGFSFIFSKLALGVTSPFILLTYRFGVSLIILTILAALGKFKVNFRGKRIFPLLVLGIFQPVLYFIGENYGILYSNATFAAVMIALVPIFSTIFASLFLGEKATVLQWIFCIVSISGVIITATQTSSDGGTKIAGILLLLLAVAAETGYAYLGRKISAEFTAAERTYAMMLCGTVVFSVLALCENAGNLRAFAEPLFSPVFIAGLFYLSVLSSVTAFLCLNFAASHLPVARTVVFANITTVVSVFAGVIFLHEKCTALSIFASVMIIAGILGVQKFAAK